MDDSKRKSALLSHITSVAGHSAVESSAQVRVAARSPEENPAVDPPPSDELGASPGSSPAVAAVPESPPPPGEHPPADVSPAFSAYLSQYVQDYRPLGSSREQLTIDRDLLEWYRDTLRMLNLQIPLSGLVSNILRLHRQAYGHVLEDEIDRRARARLKLRSRE